MNYPFKFTAINIYKKSGKDLAGISHGFTMVELLVVLFLLGLMMALTIPAFTKTLRSLKAKSTVRKIVSALKYARSEAVFKQVPQIVHFDRDNNLFWLGKDRKVSASEDIKVVKLPPEIYIKDLERMDRARDSESNSIWFYSDGSSSSGIITVVDREIEKSYRISVDFFTGLPKVAYEK